jgi:hypothetical protein
MDSFMSIYQIERKVNGTVAYATPTFSQPVMPLPTAAPAQTYMNSTPFANIPLATDVATTPVKEEKKEEGILSQDEIDALLSGI